MISWGPPPDPDLLYANGFPCVKLRTGSSLQRARASCFRSRHLLLLQSLTQLASCDQEALRTLAEYTAEE
jgi:hypothetical protein